MNGKLTKRQWIIGTSLLFSWIALVILGGFFGLVGIATGVSLATREVTFNDNLAILLLLCIVIAGPSLFFAWRWNPLK